MYDRGTSCGFIVLKGQYSSLFHIIKGSFSRIIMLAMSLKLLLLESGALKLYKRELVSNNVHDFRAVIKRCVLAESVAYGPNY